MSLKFLPALLWVVFAVPVTAWSQTASPSPPAAVTTSGEVSADDFSDGEVRRVDINLGKVTLRHGVIKHLDMPPMTMVFQVKDRSLFERLRVGERVRFRVEDASGVFVVTAVEAAKPLR